MHYCSQAAAATLQLGSTAFDANRMDYALPSLRQGHNF